MLTRILIGSYILYENMKHAYDTFVRFENKICFENWKWCVGNWTNRLKTNRESVAVLCSVAKHYVSCFSLHFFPALAVSCVLYSRTEHSQVFSSDLHTQDSANKMQVNQEQSSMNHTLSIQKFHRIHSEYFSQTS